MLYKVFHKTVSLDSESKRVVAGNFANLYSIVHSFEARDRTGMSYSEAADWTLQRSKVHVVNATKLLLVTFLSSVNCNLFDNNPTLKHGEPFRAWHLCLNYFVTPVSLTLLNPLRPLMAASTRLSHFCGRNLIQF